MKLLFVLLMWAIPGGLLAFGAWRGVRWARKHFARLQHKDAMADAQLEQERFLTEAQIQQDLRSVIEVEAELEELRSPSRR